MKHNIKNEAFFKNLASLYAEKSGNEVKSDLANLIGSDKPKSADFSTLDAKVKSRISTHKIKKWTAILTPVAACFLIFITTYIALSFPLINLKKDSFTDADKSQSGLSASPILTYEFVSLKLPSEYTLKKVDYDYQKAIYYVISADDTEIILTIEKSEENINTDGLEKIRIKDLNAYGISNEDYSFIQYKKDDYLYMLTCPNDYGDLIKISENLI